MTTLKSDEHSEKPVSSVLEQVRMERELELQKFEGIMNYDDTQFAIYLVTTPSDEEIIRFHEFLAKKEKQLSFMREEGKEDVTLTRIKAMLSKLEDQPIVQEHMQQTALTPEEETQINETVRFVEERQRIKKMGPVQKLVYNIKQKRNK